MKINNQEGFTLIEVVIALAVLSFGILSIMLMQVSGIRGNSTANTITSQSNWAADRIEQLLNTDYPNPADANYASHPLSDPDGDGTDEDPDEDGVDNDGGNFGLDDVGALTAGAACTPGISDHCAREGLYDIYWNVAVDQPLVNTMKIKVIVIQNQGRTNRVEFEYIKADLI